LHPSYAISGGRLPTTKIDHIGLIITRIYLILLSDTYYLSVVWTCLPCAKIEPRKHWLQATLQRTRKSRKFTEDLAISANSRKRFLQSNQTWLSIPAINCKAVSLYRTGWRETWGQQRWAQAEGHSVETISLQTFLKMIPDMSLVASLCLFADKAEHRLCAILRRI